MVQLLPQAPPKGKSFAQKLNAGVGAGLSMGQQLYQEHQQKQALKEAGIPENLPPELQKIALAEKLKGESKTTETATKLASNRKAIEGIEDQRDLPRGSLSAFDDPKLAEQVSRPEKTSKKTQASQPIDPQQLAIIKNVRETEAYKNADPLEKYQIMTDAGVSKENSQAEADIAYKQGDLQEKKIDKSYDLQKDFINDTTSSYKAFETEMKPRLLQMQHIPSEDLIGPTAAVFLDALGIPLGALEDPSSELYNKLSQDLLKGLPETYGSRILKVEVENFLKTIPTLLNSADGRRMIASNMLKLGEMKEVYYKEMRKQQVDALDHDKPLPKDFQQRVFDQVKPQIDRINDEFVKMSEVKAVPEGTIPFFTPSGTIKFVPKEKADAASKNGGRRIW